MHDSVTVLTRLERLEREGRRWRALAVGLGLLLVGTLAAGFATPAADVVRAQKFVLEAPDGTEHGTLALDPNKSPYLLLRRDKASAILTLSGPGLALRGEDGKRGAFLGVDSTGAAKLDLFSPKVLDGVRLAVQDNGTAGVYVLSETGSEAGSMESFPGRGALFTARDKKRLPRVIFGLDEQYIPTLMMLDNKGRRRIGMLVNPTEEGEALFAIEDGQGLSRGELAQSFDGSVKLRLLREDGKPSYEAP